MRGMKSAISLQMSATGELAVVFSLRGMHILQFIVQMFSNGLSSSMQRAATSRFNMALAGEKKHQHYLKVNPTGAAHSWTTHSPSNVLLLLLLLLHIVCRGAHPATTSAGVWPHGRTGRTVQKSSIRHGL
jgi:hypothetical protein